MPSTASTADDRNDRDEANDHRNDPSVPFKAYNTPSVEPMYTVPSTPSAGEASTGPPVANIHNTAPETQLNA